MAALLFALVALVALTSPAQTQLAVYCNTAYPQAAQSGPVAQTKIVSGQAGQSIYICGWNINNTGSQTVTVSLVAGTGPNCATNTSSAITVTVTNGQTNIDHGPALFRLPEAYDMCWTITGTGTFSGSIYYAIYGAR